MTKRHVSSCLMFVAVAGILFASTPLFAQFHSAIEGTVVDSSGAAVAGAEVVLTNQDTGVAVTATSNETGLFRFPSLGLGTYTLTANKTGFQTVKQENIGLAAEETRTVPLVLKVGQIQETVTITEDAAAIQLAESKISSGISSQEITELPLTGRNIFNLVSMTPGVTGTGQAAGGAFDNSVFSLVNGGNTNANGQRGDANAFYLDNTYATSNPDPGVYNLTPNPDSVAEVHVSVNDYSAEYGHSAGLVIQAVTKSGTNQFHGSLFEYHTDNHLRAVTLDETASSIPTSRRNEFGGSIGGPIQKDKMFAFFSWDQLRSAAAGTLFGQVETADFVNFMTTNFPNNLSTQLMNKYPAQRPNPSNIVTVQDLDPNCATVAPVAGISCSLDVLENVTEGVAPKTNGLQWTFRIDRYFRDSKDRINGSFFRKTPDVITPNLRPAFNTLNAFQGITNYANLDWTHTFSPNLLNDAAFGITRISGLGVCNQCQVPPINIAASTTTVGFGTGFAPAEFLQNDFHWRDVLSYNHGKHAWKAGFEAFRDQENDLFSGPQLRPGYNFVNGSPAGGVNALFDFANDAPDQETNINFNLITGGPAFQNVGYRQTTFGFFVQDDYKVKSNLSINAGLRWDFSSNPNEVNNRMTNLVLGSGSNLEQQIAGASVAVVKHLYTDNRIGYFAPRLGFAWDPTKQGKLSIRGGVGVFFNRPPNKVWSDAIRNNPPFEGGPITATLGSSGPQPAYGLCQLAVNPFNCDIPSGLPIGLNPGGGAIGQVSSAGGTLPDLKYSYNIARFIGVQYGITPNWVVEADYSGSHDVHLYVNTDLNRCLGCFSPVTGSQIGFIPNPNFIAINLTDNVGWSHYNGASFSVLHKFNRSFTFQAAYTVGHTVDNVDSIAPGHNASYGTVYSPYDPNFQAGTAQFDIKNAVIMHGVWELPKLSGMNPIVRGVLGSWQMTGAASFQGGYPYTVLDCNHSPDGVGGFDGDADIGGTDCVLPNVAAGYAGHGCNKAAFIKGCLDPTQFSPPCPLVSTNTGDAAGDYGAPQLNCTSGVWEGNSKRDAFRGPGYANVDFSAGKYFRIPWFTHEGAKLQIRGDFFNFLNRTNISGLVTNVAFVAPTPAPSPGGPQTVTVPVTAPQPGARFVSPTGAFNPRTIQVAVRLEF
jgi:Carboxypeptidase regulatory-like domain/TonB dependent receptor-like, beta-barrel